MTFLPFVFSWLLGGGSFVCTASPAPAPPSFERLSQIKTKQDVLGVAVLGNGSNAPAELILPDLQNRRQTLQFMLAHYPEGKAARPGKGTAIAWVCVDRRGRVGKAVLANSSGNATFDSLALRALEVAWFVPGRIGNDTVDVWIPLPARVPTKDELNVALALESGDRSAAPVHTEFTEAPVLINRARVEDAIMRTVFNVNRDVAARTERFMRAQNAGGTVVLWVYIDATGNLTNSVLKKTSGNTDLDQSAHQVAAIMQFRPALNKGKPVDVWIEVPIAFKGR
jgi:TonB family protein